MKYRLFIEIIENGKPLRLAYVAKSLSECVALINRYYGSLIEIELRDFRSDELIAFYYSISRKSAPLKYAIYIDKYSSYQIKKNK